MRLTWVPFRRVTAPLAVVALLASIIWVTQPADDECLPGFERVAERELSPADRAHLAPQYRGGATVDWGGFRAHCLAVDRPETFTDLALRDAQHAAVRTAPFTEVAAGANLAAAAAKRDLLTDDVVLPGADGTFEKYGVGPIEMDDPRYPAVNGSGLVDSTGRIDDLEYDPASGRVFAAIGTGGVWLSDDLGQTWRPITDDLPTTVVGAVAYSPAGGESGTVAVVTGEHTFGGAAYTGIGVWYSRDLGETWRRAAGPPDGALGFAIEVDPSDPTVLYAATGNGLWRSTDAGASYTDVVLPTGDCAGDYDDDRCNFANFVTDVVVKAPGGTTDAEGGEVVAAVGWRAGMAESPDGNVQSCCNGIYRSATGEPGTFEYQPGLEAAIDDGGRERIGRMELGPAVGDEQDHGYLYLIMQDAVLFQSGFPYGPIPGDTPTGLNPTVLNGIYVSSDFGQSWTQLANDQEISNSCPAHESVFCIPGLIEPGIQSWFNMWIQPDPTLAVAGVPTRLLFGLEEVWQNREQLPTATDATTSFEVIGRYYGSPDCLLVATNCVVNKQVGITTTHPDQHAALILPEPGEEGGSRLLVGHDGGFSWQRSSGAADPFDQQSWQLEQKNGLQTLLSYSAVIANDGVAYAGLQDNGHIRISPEDGFRQFETYGADGTFAAVDPENSDYVIESTQNAGMNVSTDGGQTWRSIRPPADNVRFVNPFVMDPLDPDHIVTGGRQIVESLAGPRTADGEEGNDWKVVFDLGTSERDVQYPTQDAPEKPSNGMSAIDTRGDATYVGFCGVCDILNTPFPFQNGIATNVGHDEELPEAGTSDGWHVATAKGLPNRFITSVAIDPMDPTQKTIYVTLGGYSRKWVPPGSVNDANDEVGSGHVFKSTDAGETFVDISKGLPDLPATWVEPRGDHLLVAMDNGVYISSDTVGRQWDVLGGGGLPNTPVTSLQLKPDDPDVLLVGTYGRGMWVYRFPDDEVSARRLEGPSRVQTAVAVSEATRESSDAVVIARADVYADALAGAPLAAKVDAPVLLTAPDALHPDTAAEVERLGASRAILLGGHAALSEQVEEDLAAVGVTEVQRFGGENRYDTARLIAGAVGGGSVYVTEGAHADPGRGWPDAMSIAPVAAHQGRPILLVERDRLPSETVAALEEIHASRARIVGGTAAVSAEVEEALSRRVALDERIAGRDRYATSVAAAEVGRAAGLNVRHTWLATGASFPDALAAGPQVARSGGVLLLVDGDDLDDSPATRDFLHRHICAVDVVTVLGGRNAISARAQSQATSPAADCASTAPSAPPAPGPTLGPWTPPTDAPRTTVAGPFGFESDVEGWTVTNASPGTPPTSWSRESGEGHDSEWSFEVVPYGELADTRLTSPEFEAPEGDVFVTWWHTLDVEGGGYDELAVEWSVDGSEWTRMATRGGQNVGYPAYAEEVASFKHPGGAVQVRFRFYSDEVCSSNVTGPNPLCAVPEGYEGVRVDDVAIQIPR